MRARLPVNLLVEDPCPEIPGSVEYPLINLQTLEGLRDRERLLSVLTLGQLEGEIVDEGDISRPSGSR